MKININTGHRFFFFCFFSFTQLYSQIDSAQYFYSRQNYIKALPHYQALFNEAPEQYYQLYFECLINSKKLITAEQELQTLIKQQSHFLPLKVLLGLVYQKQQNTKKMNKLFDKILNELNAQDDNQVYAVGNAFFNNGFYQQAINIYTKARLVSKQITKFYAQMADAYKMQNKIQDMITEYLNVIEASPSEMPTAKGKLQQSLIANDSVDPFQNPILSNVLQERVNKQPNNKMMNDFLIFILIHQKKYNEAFIQIKAKELRENGNGEQLLNFAKICESNLQYNIADKCYKFILEKLTQSQLTKEVKVQELLNLITKNLASTNGDLKILTQLDKEIQQTIQTYSITSLTVPLIKQSAKLNAYYFNKTELAIVLLEEAITSVALQKKEKAELKILLGDIYILNKNIWESALLYGQVEKDFKYEAIGDDAKFKNAKVSYYVGDFKWAKSQCDVLKHSTSKVIANDALELSMVISDAIGVDTNDVPLKYFANAELLIAQHQFDLAIQKLDTISILFTAHTLYDDIYFKKATIYKEINQLPKTINCYLSIINNYADDVYADDAVFYLAALYQQVHDFENAKIYYEKLIIQYASSIHAIEAKNRIRLLRGDFYKKVGI